MNLCECASFFFFFLHHFLCCSDNKAYNNEIPNVVYTKNQSKNVSKDDYSFGRYGTSDD
jgi:hypothetical protein